MKAKRALKSQNSVQAARGNPARGGKLRQGQTVRVAEHESVHLHNLVHDKSLLGTVYSSLAGFIQRNVSFEVQKAIAINMMVTALVDWNCTILQAAQHAADCCGFNTETVRLWATALISEASTCSVEEINDDEHITQCLESNRGHHDNYCVDSLLRSEDFCLAARAYIRSHACKKGEPNMTSKMFTEWVEKEYGTKIHESTGCRWLQQLGFSRVHHQKGVYFDGHDR